MGGYPLLDAGKTPEGTLSLVFDLLDQLPVSVAVYGAQAGFPLLYCNPRMAERREAVPQDLDLTCSRVRRLPACTAVRSKPPRPWAGAAGST